MLRVTTEASHGCITLRLEGRLGEAWVKELEQCWAQAIICPERVAVDLTAVTFIDQLGRELLERMHRSGTALVGGNLPLTCYIVEQIKQTA
jgi:anti-anti-sigma regulatory factor